MRRVRLFLIQSYFPSLSQIYRSIALFLGLVAPGSQSCYVGLKCTLENNCFVSLEPKIMPTIKKVKEGGRKKLRVCQRLCCEVFGVFILDFVPSFLQR